ncbi:MAG: AmmeMemoRadiSam system radical SAM enzyme [Candidatus Omnitrophota bacterium]
MLGAGLSPKNAFAKNAAPDPHEAMFYKNLDEETVRCELCPHQCVLGEGDRGFCRVRECINGKLYSLVYELPCSIHVDPIEKKPMFHMLPASKSFSLATAGCNSRCRYCQNWQISQSKPEETENIKFTKEQAVSGALEAGCKSIAYTYSEPNVFYEYGLDTARLARSKGIKNIWVTGGLINPDPLRKLAGCVEAANIDFKAYDDNFLRERCAQNLKTITDTIKISKGCGMWIEITNLIVPTLNDDLSKIRKMAVWIRENVGKDVPLHFSRFWPMYKLKNLPPTPVATLEKARETALEAGLEYVYIGNLPGHEGNNTYCPSCKSLVIGRNGYLITEINMSGPKCGSCGHEIPGIWT